MTKFIITFTDRGWRSELDLRKEKLHDLVYLSFFKVDEKGNVLATESTATYFNTSSKLHTIKRFLTDRLSENKEDRSIFSNYMSPSALKNFLKFTKKYGKVVELESIDISFLDVLNSFDESAKIIFDKIDKLKSTFTAVDYLDKKGRYRKIDCKNIIIYRNSSSYQESVFYISDNTTTITYSVKGSYTYDYKLKDENMTYYGYYNLGGERGFKILRASKKGREEFVTLLKEISELNEKRAEVIKNYILNFFK